MALCPICKEQSLRNFQNGLYDDRFGYPGRFDLLKCTKCDHVFIDAAFTPEELSKLYTDFYPRSGYKLEEHRPLAKGSRLGDWMRGARSGAVFWVPPGVRVLDIGCGSCESLGYLRNQGCSAYGVEADENVRAISQRYGYRVEIGLFDDSVFEADFFDYVIMDQVIEHMVDPFAVLRGIARILKPGGVTIITTPNVFGWGTRFFGRKWINWHVPYHIGFYSRRSIGFVAAKAGLSLKKAITATPSAWLDYQWYHLLRYPTCGTPSQFWTSTMDASSLQTGNAKLIRGLNQFKVDHLITRAFDFIGLGDNYVFMLTKP
jgi:2-polyprenyl-3-methyl-5-hydroxy-6-metoxy-1,4-benzoquinol methylase